MSPARLHLSLRTCLFGLVLSACQGKPDAAQTVPTFVEMGAPAPPIVGTTVTGETLALADLRGKVVLINVWATWCEPCREEMPELQALHARLSARGFLVLGVSIDARREAVTVRNTVSGFGLTYPVIHDADNRIGAPYKLVGYPASFLVDRQGVVRWRRDGLIKPNDPDLAAAIEQALAEPG